MNSNYVEKFEAKGLVVSARSKRAGSGRGDEYPQSAHPWFLGVVPPEFNPTPRNGHPLFKAFVGAAMAQREARQNGQR